MALTLAVPVHNRDSQIPLEPKKGDTVIVLHKRALIYGISFALLVPFLLRTGADVHARDKKGRTPPIYAAEHGTPENIMAQLVAAADLNGNDNDGNTALKLARKTNFVVAEFGIKAVQEAVKRKETGQQLQTRTDLRGHTKIVVFVAFAPDGKTLASNSVDGTVKLWDVVTGKVKYTLQGNDGTASSVAFSPDGQTLAFGSTGNTIKLCDVTNGKEKTSLKGHNEDIAAVAWSPDGTSLASASEDQTIKLWDVAKRKEKATVRVPEWTANHTAIFFPLVFTPDSKTLASWSFRDIKFWDVATAKEKNLIKAHTQPVWCVAFSRNGTTMASGGQDRTVKLWDVPTRKQRATLKGHRDDVLSVAFTPDGAVLASASADRTIKLWDVASGIEKATLKGHSDYVWTVAISPDGKTLASADSNGTIKLWDVPATWQRP